MSEAETILKMIEAVGKDDTDTLDEIDARYWCWRNGHSYTGHTYWTRDDGSKGVGITPYHEPERVSRSRDALKKERPEGWVYELLIGPTGKSWMDIHRPYDSDTYPLTFGKGFKSPVLPTEELAEFHAIVQAKVWEENNE